MRISKALFVPVAAVALALPLVSAPATAAPTVGAPVVADDHEVNIIGGDVERKVRPWNGRLSNSCGASVIAERWLVTAAHCLKSGNSRPTTTVRLGTLKKWSGGTVRNVMKEFRHPDYPNNARNNKRYDIGLVKLESAYRGGHVDLATKRYADGTPTRIIGWGAVKENSDGTLEMAEVLRGLDTSVVADRECSTATGVFMPGFEYCTDNPRGKAGACYGDSGGPQFTNDGGREVLIGVTSRGGKKCGLSPSVYTDVYAYQAWILSTIKREDGSLPPELAGWTVTPTPNPGTPAPGKPTPDPVEPTPDPVDPGQDEFVNKERIAIEDYRTAKSSINSTFAGAKKVTLSIDITHSCSQNLGIVLVTPDGRRNTLKRGGYSRRCTSWNGTLSDTYSMRTKSNGNWTLEISDGYRGNTGTLKGWSLKFQK